MDRKGKHLKYDDRSLVKHIVKKIKLMFFFCGVIPPKVYLVFDVLYQPIRTFDFKNLWFVPVTETISVSMHHIVCNSLQH
jgi:hypothetical protein